MLMLRLRELILDEKTWFKNFLDRLSFLITPYLCCVKKHTVTSTSDLSFYGIERLDIRARLFNIIIDVTDVPPLTKTLKNFNFFSLALFFNQ